MSPLQRSDYLTQITFISCYSSVWFLQSRYCYLHLFIRVLTCSGRLPGPWNLNLRAQTMGFALPWVTSQTPAQARHQEAQYKGPADRKNQWAGWGAGRTRARPRVGDVGARPTSEQRKPAPSGRGADASAATAAGPRLAPARPAPSSVPSSRSNACSAAVSCISVLPSHGACFAAAATDCCTS